MLSAWASMPVVHPILKHTVLSFIKALQQQQQQQPQTVINVISWSSNYTRLMCEWMCSLLQLSTRPCIYVSNNNNAKQTPNSPLSRTHPHFTMYLTILQKGLLCNDTRLPFRIWDYLFIIFHSVDAKARWLDLNCRLLLGQRSGICSTAGDPLVPL